MTTASLIGIMGCLITSLKENDIPPTELKIQKSAYILKCISAEAVNVEFILYKHGPYSFALEDVILQARAENIFKIEIKRGRAPIYEVDELLWVAVDRASGSMSHKYRDLIKFVCTSLKDRSPVEIENIATTIFVKKMYPNADGWDLVKKIIDTRGHVSSIEATTAIAQSRVFLEKISDMQSMAA